MISKIHQTNAKSPTSNVSRGCYSQDWRTSIVKQKTRNQPSNTPNVVTTRRTQTITNWNSYNARYLILAGVLAQVVSKEERGYKVATSCPIRWAFLHTKQEKHQPGLQMELPGVEPWFL